MNEIKYNKTCCSSLDPNANTFCPSFKINNIFFANKYRNNLNCVYSNLQGIFEACHFDEFSNEILRSNNIHICAITETWLRNRINPLKSVNMNGFNIFRSDRIGKLGDHDKGGGVALLVKKNIKCKIIHRSSTNGNEIRGTEFIFTEITINHIVICIVVIYRTNACLTNDTMRLFLKIIEITSNYNHVLIFGDFNINIVNGTGSLKNLNDFFNVVNHFCATHKWPNAQPSLIDIILTKNLENIQCYSHYNLIPSTHHDLLCVSYKIKQSNLNQPTKFSYRNYNKIDPEQLMNEALQIDWSDCFNGNNIDKMVEIINKNYWKLFNNNVPLVHVKLKCSSKPWFSSDLIPMLKLRKSLYDKCKINNFTPLKPLLRKQFRDQCVKIKNRINFLKRNKFADAIKKSKSNKSKWNILKSIGCGRDKNHIDASSNLNANDLNDYYIKLHTSEPRLNPDFCGNDNIELFNFEPIIATDVIDAIKEIKSSSVGFDNISIKFLKIILPFFLDAITHIFNFSLKNCVYPKIWNTIIILPIAKNNDPKLVTDTRPITLNSVMTKIFTHIINSQILNHINRNNLLSEYQSGFRSYHSCTTALIRVFEDIRGNIAKNKLTILVLLDIKSAYPSVSHVRHA